MKKLLIITETYYPDSRATISIIHRMAEELVRRGVEVFVVPLKSLPGNKVYPKEVSGVKILSANDFEERILTTTQVRFLQFLQKTLSKLLYLEKHFLLKNADSTGFSAKWNTLIQFLRNYQRSQWYNPVSQKVRNIQIALSIAPLIHNHQIDCLTSISLPFWIHNVGSLIMARANHCTWVPICFDPYSYDQTVDSATRRKRYRAEHKTFYRAEKILMLTQSKSDYATDPLLPKIRFFDIPNLRRINAEHMPTEIHFDNTTINCVFIGNLYWTVRNPNCLLNLFQQFSHSKIKLFIVGSLSYDFPRNYIEHWKDRLGTAFEYYPRVSSEEAAAIMNSADILVNIGNTTSNQCPSKILEYISTGKPILNISKIENCTSKIYLENYPLAFSVSEVDLTQQEVINSIEDFILSNRTKRMNFDSIAAQFSNCTTEAAITVFQKSFEL